MSLDRKRWAQRAVDSQFEQLASVRARAEQWRNGLVGLTALLTAVTIVKGPDSASKLPSNVRADVVDQLTWSFLFLIAGSLLAMFAAFGIPGRRQLMTGATLRRWELNQAGQSRKALILGGVVFLVGVVILGSATREVILHSGPASPIVAFDIGAGGVVCGTTVSSSQGTVTVKVSDEFGMPEDVVVSLRDVERFGTPETCPS